MGTVPSASPTRVLVFERIDPTDESLQWLEAQGVLVTEGARCGKLT